VTDSSIPAQRASPSTPLRPLQAAKGGRPQGAGRQGRLPGKEAARRLAKAQTLWLATVRPTGSPHLVPVWFAWLEGCFFVCTAPESVKARNLDVNPRVVVALEDGVHPLICEGEGATVPRPWPPDVVSTFRSKYDWSIEDDAQYARLVQVRPTRWHAW